MKLILTCHNSKCHGRFKVQGPGERTDYAHLPDESVYVECPYCKARNSIRWPRGIRFLTAPER